MEQYIKKSAIKAEIKRELESIVNATNDHAIGRRFELGNLESFLDSFEEPTNEDLEEAAYKASLNNFVDPENLDDDELRNFDWIKYYGQVFKTGALWQKRQDSIEAKAVNLEKEFDNYANGILACDIQFEPFTHLHNCAKYFFELGLKVQRKISFVPNIDDSLKELGVDTSSTEAKIFKESYYMALENFKALKGK